mmetsp:Transcript_45509/g.99118  ORF Transcript_45509/g.99118 Transcript_45509/m.99118 type:complete len:258 (-) Transcript_45509:53-826(-)
MMMTMRWWHARCHHKRSKKWKPKLTQAPSAKDAVSRLWLRLLMRRTRGGERRKPRRRMPKRQPRTRRKKAKKQRLQKRRSRKRKPRRRTRIRRRRKKKQTKKKLPRPICRLHLQCQCRPAKQKIRQHRQVWRLLQHWASMSCRSSRPLRHPLPQLLGFGRPSMLRSQHQRPLILKGAASAYSTFAGPDAIVAAPVQRLTSWIPRRKCVFVPSSSCKNATRAPAVLVPVVFSDILASVLRRQTWGNPERYSDAQLVPA